MALGIIILVMEFVHKEGGWETHKEHKEDMSLFVRKTGFRGFRPGLTKTGLCNH